MRGFILDRSPLKAHFRNLILRMMPDSLKERGVRRFFDTEHPLAEVPVNTKGA